MARRPLPLEDSLGMEIYNLMLEYCGQSNVIPSPYAFWSNVLVGQAKYSISRGGFEHWLMRLQIPRVPGEQPLIERDPLTGAYRLRDLSIQKR